MEPKVDDSPGPNVSSVDTPPPPILLAGPTAVGKSALALGLAEQIGGEIVSVDSMQVYRGLNIGTAKPSLEERQRVPHHLIDILELTESFDAAQFVRRATQAVAEIRARRRVPIFCGGTGLYFKAYLEGLGAAPPTDARLRGELERTPLPDLLRELRQLDPATSERIDRHNPRRVVRALEIIRLTGRPLAPQRANWKKLEPLSSPGTPADAGWFICLTRSTEDLRRRIDARVEAMFAQGLVEETRQLLATGLGANPTALQALGYRQVVEYLRGERPLAETVELVKVRTRQFAKRQMTWFRHQARGHWVPLAERQDLAGLARGWAQQWSRRVEPRPENVADSSQFTHR